MALDIVPLADELAIELEAKTLLKIEPSTRSGT